MLSQLFGVLIIGSVLAFWLYLYLWGRNVRVTENSEPSDFVPSLWAAATWLATGGLQARTPISSRTGLATVLLVHGRNI